MICKSISILYSIINYYFKRLYSFEIYLYYYFVILFLIIILKMGFINYFLVKCLYFFDFCFYYNFLSYFPVYTFCQTHTTVHFWVHKIYLIVSTRTPENPPWKTHPLESISDCLCLLLFWFGFLSVSFRWEKACESLFRVWVLGFRIRTAHTHRPTTGTKLPSNELIAGETILRHFPKWILVFGLSRPRVLPCFVRSVQHVTTVPARTRRHFRPLLPTPRVSQFVVVVWHIVNQRLLSTITRVPRVRVVSCRNLHIFLINRMKFSYNFLVEPIWLIKFSCFK